MLTTLTKTGWFPLKAIDLHSIGEGPGTCERCNKTNLRFLHMVAHPTEGELSVGSECAKRICFGYSPEREERRLRNLWGRRSRWLTRNWGKTWKGNETLTFDHDGHRIRVTVFKDQMGAFGYCVMLGGVTSFSSEKWDESDEAKLAAFDHLAEACEW